MLLQSSRGRSMERATFQRGPKSSSVKAASLLSWTVKPQPHLETPAHLTRLLNSPAQVLYKSHSANIGLYYYFIMNNINCYFLFSCLCTEYDAVRLAEGSTRCIGRVEMHHQDEWRTVDGWSDWNQNSSSVVCRQLHCGSAVSTERTFNSTPEGVWWISSSCVGSESSLKECGTKMAGNSSARLEVVCSGKTTTSTFACSYCPPVRQFVARLPEKLYIYCNGKKLCSV